MDFTKLLKNAYKNGGITITSKRTTIYYIEPIIKLPKEVEEHLLKGDGQKNKNEYKQINSSTGLAVNYYKILEDTVFIHGIFNRLENFSQKMRINWNDSL